MSKESLKEKKPRLCPVNCKMKDNGLTVMTQIIQVFRNFLKCWDVEMLRGWEVEKLRRLKFWRVEIELKWGFECLKSCRFAGYCNPLLKNKRFEILSLQWVCASKNKPFQALAQYLKSKITPNECVRPVSKFPEPVKVLYGFGRKLRDLKNCMW